MKQIPPAKFYRDLVRAGIYSDLPNDEDLHSFLKRNYEELKAQQTGSKDYGVFLTSVGLLAFGNLNVYEDILDNLQPSQIQSHRTLAYSTKYLVPLPDGMDPYRDTEEVRQWFRGNRDRLCWDEETGRFVFKSEMDRTET